MIDVGALVGFLTDHRSAAGSIGNRNKIISIYDIFQFESHCEASSITAHFPVGGRLKQILTGRYEIMIGLRQTGY